MCLRRPTPYTQTPQDVADIWWRWPSSLTLLSLILLWFIFLYFINILYYIKYIILVFYHRSKAVRPRAHDVPSQAKSLDSFQIFNLNCSWNPKSFLTHLTHLTPDSHRFSSFLIDSHRFSLILIDISWSFTLEFFGQSLNGFDILICRREEWPGQWMPMDANGCQSMPMDANTRPKEAPVAALERAPRNRPLWNRWTKILGLICTPERAGSDAGLIGGLIQLTWNCEALFVQKQMPQNQLKLDAGGCACAAASCRLGTGTLSHHFVVSVLAL